MDNKIRFGPAGNSEVFYKDGYKHSIDAPFWCNKHNLGAYEYSFGRGFTMSDDTVKLLGENARQNDVLISFHAPYYINLANPDDEMAKKSFEYIRK